MDLVVEEYTFMVENGPVGINLQCVRGGNGVFIESFYRSNDGAKLAAERNGAICIGDRIVLVGNSSVWNNNSEEVREIISLAAGGGPFCVTVRRIPRKSSLMELIKDPRCSGWLSVFLESYCLPLEAKEMARKARLVRELQTALSWQAFPLRDEASREVSRTEHEAKHFCIECIVGSLEQYPTREISDTLIGVVRLLVLDEDVPLTTLLAAAEQVLCLVEKDLARTLLLKFDNCSLARQMAGWMSESPSFTPVAMIDIMRVNALLALYFVFLFKSGRHHLVGALLRKRRMSRELVPSGRAAEEAEELEKAVILEAVRFDLLLAFHGSQYFEHVAVAAAAAGGGSVASVLAQQSSILQQTLRSVPLPPGLSLHRRKLSEECVSDGAGEPVIVHVLLFRTTFEDDTSQPTTHICGSASVSVFAAVPSIVARGSLSEEDSGRLTPILLPLNTLPSGEKLVSYTFAQSAGAHWYGASMVQPGVAGKILPHVPAAADMLFQNSDHPLTDHRSSAPVDTTGEESMLNVVFAKGQPALALSRVTDGAGQLLRGIRQWGEASLPPVVRVPSLSSMRSFSASTPSAEPTTPLTPFFWEMGSAFSSAWMKPASAHPALQSQEEEHDADYELWDSGVVAAPVLRGKASGVALLCTHPTLDTLRKLLRSVQPIVQDWIHADNSDDVALELAHALSKSDTLHELSNSACRRFTTDFNPDAIYEILSPQNLTTLLCATLLEFKIVLVSTDRVTLALLVGEWLKLATQPLEWCHIYAPVVPQHLALELVQCPAPYLLGIARETLRAARAVPPADAVVVDLDSGAVRVPSELKALLPAAAGLTKELVSTLQPHSSCCDSVGILGPRGSSEVLTICQNFVRNLLTPVSKCVVVLEAADELLVALDEEKFVRKARDALCPSNSDELILTTADRFLRLFVRSQSFSEDLLTTVSRARGDKD